jgi:hypothetical protein
VYFQKPNPPATGNPPYVCRDNIEAVATIWAFAEAHGVIGYVFKQIYMVKVVFRLASACWYTVYSLEPSWKVLLLL